MKSINYLDLANHILLHKDMINELSDLIKNLERLNFIEIENNLYHFIEEYFLNHIITQDKRINLWNTPLENLKDTLSWKDAYKVNNEFIDKDHKILFEIAQEAFEFSPSHEQKVKNHYYKII